MEPKQFEKFNEINKDTVKAEAIMSPEEKEASKERERKVFYRETENFVESEVEEMRPKIIQELKQIVREDMLDNEMIRRVIHEYKKIDLARLAPEVLSNVGLLGDRTKAYYDGESHRGRGVLAAFGGDRSSLNDLFFKSREKDIENIKNTVDVEHYSKLVTANLSLIDSISIKDFDKVEDSLRQIEILNPKLVESYRKRISIIEAMLEKWMNGEIYVADREKSDEVFLSATDDKKLEFIERIAKRECFNFGTDANDSEKYCLGCGRAPEGFSVSKEDWQG